VNTRNDIAPDRDTDSGVRPLPAIVEVLASALALGAIGALFFNWLDVYLVFFGETPVVTPEHVHTYHVALLALAVGIVLAFVAAGLRRHAPTRSMWWHGLVLVVGLVAAALFHVALDAPADERTPSPPVESHPVCFGTSGHCPGG